MRGLHILQYNAGKSAERQQTLLANPKLQYYDVIMLQVPKHNSQTGGTYCSWGSGFWPVYEAQDWALEIGKQCRWMTVSK